jgi:hypothetical protein
LCSWFLLPRARLFVAADLEEKRGGDGRVRACACDRGGRRLFVSSFCGNGFPVWLFPCSTVPVVLRAGVASEDGSNSVASSSFQS